MKSIVADSGPLIALAGVELLHLPALLYETAYITEAVLAECQVDPARPGAVKIRDALSEGLFQSVPDPPIPFQLVDAELGAGECSVLAYAAERRLVVLLDEERGRRKARQLAVPVIGICGLVAVAKRKGIVPDAGAVLRRARNNGYFLSEALIRQVEAMTGE